MGNPEVLYRPVGTGGPLAVGLAEGRNPRLAKVVHFSSRQRPLKAPTDAGGDNSHRLTPTVLNEKLKNSNYYKQTLKFEPETLNFVSDTPEESTGE